MVRIRECPVVLGLAVVRITATRSITAVVITAAIMGVGTVAAMGAATAARTACAMATGYITT
jgi:hypothetical protein